MTVTARTEKEGRTVIFTRDGEDFLFCVSDAAVDYIRIGMQIEDEMPDRAKEIIEKIEAKINPPKDIHIPKTRKDTHLGYRMKGHSICEYCENHYNLEDDPAGACIEDVAIFAHFEDCIHGPIDAEDFLTGLLPVKELIDGKVIVNCPNYKFNSDPTAEFTP